jgi:hypothetical protein
MRYLIFLIIYLGMYSFQVLSQDTKLNLPLDPDTQTIIYQEVVEEEGSKEELFNRGSTWLRIFYANPVAVSKVRDMASGLIRGQHQFRVHHTDEGGNKIEGDMIMYTFKLEFKDERYRYSVYDFVVKKISRYPVEKWMNKEDPDYNPLWDQYLKQIDGFIREKWVPSLKTNMKPEVKKVEEEW